MTPNAVNPLWYFTSFLKAVKIECNSKNSDWEKVQFGMEPPPCCKMNPPATQGYGCNVEVNRHTGATHCSRCGLTAESIPDLHLKTFGSFRFHKAVKWLVALVKSEPKKPLGDPFNG